jgi:hypothetical protein
MRHGVRATNCMHPGRVRATGGEGHQDIAEPFAWRQPVEHEVMGLASFVAQAKHRKPSRERIGKRERELVCEE